MGSFRRFPEGLAAVICCALLVAAFSFTLLDSRAAYAGDAQIEQGKKVYNSRCVICHGPKGDGKGLIDLVHRVQ